MARAKSNENGRLDESVGNLKQSTAALKQVTVALNQATATFLARCAETDAQIAETRRQMDETERRTSERFARIIAILMEHDRILRALPDVICEMIIRLSNARGLTFVRPHP